MDRKKVTIPEVLRMKKEGRKITKINLHDYPTAVLADRAGIEMVMVGDLIGMVVMGYDNTIPVTLEEIIHHCKAVVRGAKHCLVVGDMPFMSYQVSVEDAVRNAGRLFKETGIDAVKLEGGAEIAEKVRAIVGAAYGFEKEVDFVSCYLPAHSFKMPERVERIAKRVLVTGGLMGQNLQEQTRVDQMGTQDWLHL